MENQHEQIKGYRSLSQEEINLMNEIKEMAVKVGELVQKVSTANPLPGGVTMDQRWVSIARTDLQKGFMALVRSVAKPETF